MTTKLFPIESLLTLTTGKTIQRSFLKIQECVEYVAGHPVFPHELAERQAVEALGRLVLAQHPALADAEAVVLPSTGVDAYMLGYIARAAERFGVELAVEKGAGVRTESPLETFDRLFPDKEAIVVER